MADYIFLQPPGRMSLDGGGAYVNHLMAALHAAGHSAVMSDQHAPAAGGIVVIDGMGLSAAPSAAVPQAVALIHHFAALPGHAVLPQLRRVVATSDAVATRLVAEFGVPSERVAVVTPGVPHVARSTGSGGPRCNVLSVGALVPRKGHAVLLAALLKLFDLDWRLTVVGDTERDPATADALRKQAEPAGDRVRFAGPVDDAVLDALWRTTDLFALATEWEGHGAAICEALRRGVPVAVTAGGAAAAAMTAQAGVVCEVGDVVNFSKSLRRMIYDADLRAGMAEAAWHAGVTLPDWAQQAEQFVAATT